jgi:hypothetical protein
MRAGAHVSCGGDVLKVKTPGHAPITGGRPYGLEFPVAIEEIT